MKIHYRMLYLPITADVKRTRPYWNAWNFTIGVKNGQLSEKTYIILKIGGQRRQFDNSNIKELSNLAGQWWTTLAIEQLGEELGTQVSFVPIPSKDAVVEAEPPFRSLTMLTKCLDGISTCQVIDALRFTEQIQKASEGGPRDASTFYDKLVVTEAPPESPVILVDDIYTSGAHMKACRKRLDESGYDVRFGAVVARTVYSTDEPAFTKGELEIDDDIYSPIALDFGDIEI